MNNIRTDLHRPSVIIPADYEEVAYLPRVTFGNAPAVLVERERLDKHMRKTGGTYAHASHGSCDICGNVQAMSHVIFYHKASNSYIRVGEICASKMDLSWDDARYSAFKKDYKRALEFKAGKAKAQATLIAGGREWAWDIYAMLEATPIGEEHAKLWNEFTREDQTAYDMVDKLVRYGSLSEKQIAYLDKLPEIKARNLERKLEWAKRDQKIRETSKHIGAIGERLTFTAKIRFAKFIENEFGGGYNDGYTITVLDTPEGNVLVWMGTGFGNVEKGKTITFKATVKDHTERDGVKQTKLTRCTEIVPPHDWTPEIEGSDVQMPCRLCGKNKSQHKAPKAPRKARKAKAAVPTQPTAEEKILSRPEPPATPFCMECGAEAVNGSIHHYVICHQHES